MFERENSVRLHAKNVGRTLKQESLIWLQTSTMAGAREVVMKRKREKIPGPAERRRRPSEWKASSSKKHCIQNSLGATNM